MTEQRTQPVRLAARAHRINESQTLAISARAASLRLEGVDVVSFGAGESDFPPPQVATSHAHEALDEHFARYTPTSGLLPLKQAIIQRYEERTSARFDPAEVIVTAGAKQALFNAFQVLVEDGDEVLVPAPYWTSYVDQVRLAGAEPIVVPPTADLGIDVDALEQRITDRTRVLIVNSPSNPSGRVLGADELARLADVVRRHDLFVVSDEIYEHLVYGGAEHRSIVLDHDLRDRGLVVSGASKTLAVTGWRIGHAVGPSAVISAMAKVQAHSTSCPNSVAQRGVLGALSSDLRPIIARMVDEYDKRRLYMLTRLRRMPQIEVEEPQGAFYTFPKVSRHYGKRTPEGALLEDSSSFARALIEEHSVAVVPGSAFGADEHIRLSYATSDNEIEKGLDRIETFLGSLS